MCYRYGKVVDVIQIPERWCAFIGYQDEAAPTLARENEQERILGGQRIYIEFPREPKSKKSWW